MLILCTCTFKFIVINQLVKNKSDYTDNQTVGIMV